MFDLSYTVIQVTQENDFIETVSRCGEITTEYNAFDYHEANACITWIYSGENNKEKLFKIALEAYPALTARLITKKYDK